MKKGFTIIELSLSIAFIAILSISVVMVITNAISSYHRGVTLNQLNTVGMTVTDDMRSAVQGSPARSVLNECATVYSDPGEVEKCKKDLASGFVWITREASVTVGKNNIKVPIYGAFCTGAYSYVWNSGYLFSDEYNVKNNIEPVNLQYKIAGNDKKLTFETPKLLKVEDSDRLICKNAVNNNGKYNKNLSQKNNFSFDVTEKAIEEEPVDVLAGSDSLAIYSLISADPALGGGANNMFYTVSFILGTIQGGININTAGNNCAPPEDYTNSALENFDYCAINKFNFAAQATGG